MGGRPAAGVRWARAMAGLAVGGALGPGAWRARQWGCSRPRAWWLAFRCPCSRPRPCRSPARTPGWTSPGPPGPADASSPSARWPPTGQTGWLTADRAGHWSGSWPGPRPPPPRPPPSPITFSFCLVSSEMLPLGESRVGVGGVTVISGGNLVAAEGMTSFGMLGRGRALARLGSTWPRWPSGGWALPLLGTLELATGGGPQGEPGSVSWAYLPLPSWDPEPRVPTVPSRSGRNGLRVPQPEAAVLLPAPGELWEPGRPPRPS